MRFDPAHVAKAGASLTESGRRNLNALPVSGGWATVSEMKPNATGSGMDLLYVRRLSPFPLCEREWVRWGGEFGQKRGEGYQYRITPFGREVRIALRARASVGERSQSQDPAEGLGPQDASAVPSEETADAPTPAKSLNPGVSS